MRAHALSRLRQDWRKAFRTRSRHAVVREPLSGKVVVAVAAPESRTEQRGMIFFTVDVSWDNIGACGHGIMPGDEPSDTCLERRRRTMTRVAVGLLSILIALSIASEASAVVCARGVVRAGCAGPNGAVVARRPVATAPVVAPVVRPACAIVNGVRVCR
jgi:hypothetical protein